MFAAVSSDDVSKKRRIDLKATEETARRKGGVEIVLKQEEESADDEIIDSIEFDYQEIADQDYEVVYEANLPGVNEEEVEEKPKIETSLKSKRKSKTLSFREKYEVIQQIIRGTPVTYICESYGIGRTTVYDYMRRKNEIIEFVEKSNDVERKTFKKSKYPEVEGRVLKWCESNEIFTKQDFYDCAKSAFDDAREQNAALSASGFCGSWAWAKRFFHRHPDLKRKLVNASGTPLDPSELSITRTEYLEENDENNESTTENIHTQDDQETFEKKVKFLTLGEKLQVLNDIDNGIAVPTIAVNFDVSKSTIYEIFKRRHEIRERKLTNLNSQQKVSKTPRYPQLELELLQWCLKQKSFPLSNVLIADKALCLFDELMLTGTFNPSSSWSKKFVLRHPELCEKQGIAGVPEATKDDDYSFQFELIDENEEISRDAETSFRFDSDNDYDEEEYIVEELDTQHDEQLEIETVFVESEQTAPCRNVKKADFVEIPDAIALKSLKILIKYSEQRGHDSILSQLIEYQSQLDEDVT